MSERVVGPLGHVMREFAADNPGTQHLVGELAEAHKRLREYEGMMTRREVLEALCEDWVRREHHELGVLSSVLAGRAQAYARVAGVDASHWMPVIVVDAAHELALLMNAERDA